MTVRFYNSLTAELADFSPIVPGRASIYYCGATVQSGPHLGHLRSAVVFDQLVRWLQYRGFTTTVIRNVTDVDDKILNKATETGEQWWALAYKHEAEFRQAYRTLNVAPVDYEPRATGHIPEMVQLISTLVQMGHAYPAPDESGDVYFDVRSWPNYGTLTHQKIADMHDAEDADPRGKRDPRDFALWKGRKPEEPASAAWQSPWGEGRPGWHIECSAMAGKYLGAQFDIHGGGLDLRFPHHENEMAQAQAAGRGYANVWMHNGMVTYRGEKMSKSIGNVISPEQMFAQASPMAARYYLGQAHYRSVLDFNPDSLRDAEAALARIMAFVTKAWKSVYQSATDVGFLSEELAAPSNLRVPEKFAAAMDDDLNLPRALAELHETVRAGNSALDGKDGANTKKRLDEVLAMVHVLGLLDPKDEQTNRAGQPALDALTALVDARLAERSQARSDKDWARSDAIRDQLEQIGIVIADGPDGASWELSDASR